MSGLILSFSLSAFCGGLLFICRSANLPPFAFSLPHRSGPRVLIFNQQGRSEAIDFLDGLHAAAKRDDGTSFDRVMFCTNVTYATTGYKRGKCFSFSFFGGFLL